MKWLTHSQTGFRQTARYLLGMRLAIVAIQLIALAIAEALVTLSHPTQALLLCMLYGILTTLGWLWFTRRPPATALAVSVGLAVDLLLIGAWLSMTGGYTNPLTSLLLLPIAVAIILVPLNQSIALTVFGIAVYTALVIWHTPVMDSHHHDVNLAQLHLFGMWVTFVLTSAILLLVVGSLARRLRRQQAQLSLIRETRLRDEQVIALGLSAAGVAHRLGTPLNTMALLIEEMRSDRDLDNLDDDLNLMEQQLQLCTGHLHKLSEAAVQAKTSQLETLSVEQWLMRLRESATLLWPAGALEWSMDFPDARVAVDATLDQAILNLLDNALTASPSWVRVSARETDRKTVEIVVEDHGDGLETTLQEAGPGQSVVDSDNGLGMGLFLSNATIQRLGGSLKAQVNQDGTTMIIELPQSQPEVEHG